MEHYYILGGERLDEIIATIDVACERLYDSQITAAWEHEERRLIQHNSNMSWLERISTKIWGVPSMNQHRMAFFDDFTMLFGRFLDIQEKLIHARKNNLQIIAEPHMIDLAIRYSKAENLLDFINKKG